MYGSKKATSGKWHSYEKIKIVKEWKTPMKIKEVESFLEFTNFY